MAQKSYYHRSFIILKVESRGYELLPNKEPTGYCKFEIRRGVGKAYLYLQDIKPSSALDGVYEAYLVSLDESIGPCKLASLYIDEKGRGEHITSFDANDIKGSGYSLENFHALVIAFRVGIEGGGMRIAYPLIGYSSRDITIDTWRITESLKVIYGEGMEMESDLVAQSPFFEDGEGGLEEEPEIEAAFRTEAEYGQVSESGLEADSNLELGTESEIKAEAETKSGLEGETELETELELEAKAQPELVTELEPVVSEPQLEDQSKTDIKSELETLGEDTKLDSGAESTMKVESEEELRQAYEDSYKGYLKDFTYRDYYHGTTYWDNVKDYFAGLFEAYERVYPFDGDLKNAQWIRIDQVVYYNNSYPDHYIVGLLKEGEGAKYVIYGIPSMYSMMPPISINGFSRWAPTRDGYGMGYWLLYIDGISGRVIYPLDKE